MMVDRRQSGSENDVYFLPSTGISQSMAKVFLGSPSAYWRWYVAQIECPPKPTASMALGTAVHALLLNGVPCFDLEIAPAVLDIVEPVIESKTARELLDFDRQRGAVVEEPIVWTDDVTGLKLKCKPDLVQPQAGIAVDLKTTHDASRFKWDFQKYGYDFQSAWYLRGLESRYPGVDWSWCWLVAQTKPDEYGRYPIRIIDFRGDKLSVARDKVRECLAELQSRYESGDWSERPVEIEEI